jgi:hypothetical protein
MTSSGFEDSFPAGRILKLRIRIRDRALHVSKTIETPDFTLEQIME